MSDRLRLRATDTEDLAVIAACLQDARVALGEMAYLAGERRFMVAFTRYRRERQKDPTSCVGLTECQSVLVFDGIAEVKHKGLGGVPGDQELWLLTIATEPGREHLIHIDLVFAGDTQIQLRTDRISCRLEDFGEPCAARVTPCDHFAADFWAQAQHGATA